jgi:hypothetical protein
VLLIPAAPASSETTLLAGLLPLDDGLAARWPWAGAWIWPVGTGCEPSGPAPKGEPAWRVLRGYCARTDSTGPHRGADLGNGRAGEPVFASAHGVVVTTNDGSDRGGFGSFAVLAHRLCEGGIAYSVYSHLRPGSLRVRQGQCVWAGELLAQVGRSGRASTDHLHFEVRLADDPGARWERTRAVDPVAFLARRLPARTGDTSWAAPYLEWAGRAALIPAAARASDLLIRRTWQLMLARGARLPFLALPGDAASLREVLIEQRLLPDHERAPLDRVATWQEVARDLTQLRELGTRLPPIPLEIGFHRAACLTRFGREQPGHDPRGVLRAAPPTLADACLLLADIMAGTPPPTTAPDPPR